MTHAQSSKSANTPRGLICATGLWVLLLFLLVCDGAEPHGLPSPLAEHFYAVQLVYLPLVVWLQLLAGRAVLRRFDRKPVMDARLAELALSRALTASILCLVVPDLLKLLVSGWGVTVPSLFPWTQVLAAAAFIFILTRKLGSARQAFAAWVATALIAIVLLR